MAERGRAPLPAPYESPWILLRRDLRALAASGRLKILELWRRNASGDLPLPAAWPRRLAPLFWPLLLAGALALLVLLLSSLPQRRPVIPVSGAGGGLESAGGPDRLPVTPPVSAGLAGEPAPAKAPPLAGAAEQETADPQTAEPQPLEQQQPEPEEPPAESSPLAAPYAADLQRLDTPPAAGAHWLEAEPLAGQGGLRLRLEEPYGALLENQREQLAALWWQRAQEEGWERLELVDPQGRRLGQSARLGSGMILLDPHLLP